MSSNIGLSLTWLLLLTNSCIPEYFINLVSMHHRTLNSLAITALPRVIMWVWLAYTQYGHGFVIIKPQKFFEKSLPVPNL